MKDDSLHKLNNNNPGNPDKVYNEELNNQGSGLFDTQQEGEARDAAKIEKALSGETQKTDSIGAVNFNDPSDNASAREREQEMRDIEEE